MKALIPLDGSDLSASILPTARKFLSMGSAAPEVHLLLVLDPSRPGGQTSGAATIPAGVGRVVVRANYPRVVESHGQALERVATVANEWLAARAAEQLPGLPVVSRAVWSDNVVDEIVRNANDLDVDAIFMATHGRSGVSHLVTGSVTEGVVRESGRPVVVLRPRT